jgi:prolyl-tRNA editing enzyme YbaK/EbsC (Cys-tRNA(Pro) deacylase)
MNAASGVAPILLGNRVEHRTARPNSAIRQGNPGKPIIRGEQIAKVLLLADGHGYALAVIPGNRRIDLAAMEQEFGRRFQIAGSDEVRRVFPDSPPRALPPNMGDADIETYVEQSLVRLSDVYFETADPRRLQHIDGESFRDLFYGAWCGGISCAEN